MRTQKFESTLTSNVLSTSSGSRLRYGLWYNTAALLMSIVTSGTPTFLISLTVSRTSNLFETSTTKP